MYSTYFIFYIIIIIIIKNAPSILPNNNLVLIQPDFK